MNSLFKEVVCYDCKKKILRVSTSQGKQRCYECSQKYLNRNKGD